MNLPDGLSEEQFGTAAVINYTNSGAFTRQTDWSRLPVHAGNADTRTVTREEPCDYRENNFERYYPVKMSDGSSDTIYKRYLDLATGEPALTFIGRCGTYQYLDMHQVINQSLITANTWLATQGIRRP